MSPSLLRPVRAIVRLSAIFLTTLVILCCGSLLLARILHCIPLVVKSGSMEPAIHTGSLVLVSGKKEPALGDVIAFQPEGAELPTTHRIVRICLLPDESGAALVPSYGTKGDANEAEDGQTVSAEEVIGVVVGSVPRAGYVLSGTGRRESAVLVGWILGLNLLNVCLGGMSEEEEREDGRKHRSAKHRRKRRHVYEKGIHVYEDEEDDPRAGGFGPGDLYDDWFDPGLPDGGREGDQLVYDWQCVH